MWDLGWLDPIDPRLRDSVRQEYEQRAHRIAEPLPRGRTVALVGHRAAGKSSLLPHLARRLGRPPVDLDDLLARQAQRSLRDWVRADEASFRAAERAAFLALPPGSVVSVGGGFLSHHGEALIDAVAVLVPITFETYRERLLKDTSRPRLRPRLTLEEELRVLFDERSGRHLQFSTRSVAEVFRRAEVGLRAARVVTLPPGAEPRQFAYAARRAGAEWLEVRSDLQPPALDLRATARVLPLLVAERGAPIPEAWRTHARLVDREGPGASLCSFHATAPLRPDEALKRWELDVGQAHVKHVEPLGDPRTAKRLFEVQQRLGARFGPERVSVLATGPLALPFRALLSRQNALEYLALESTWAAAPGQRLLADAVREHRAGLPSARRLGIVGHPVARSRSPAIHPQPFDRLDVPPDTELGPLLDALHPHYAGFAVTSPFKGAAARHVGASIDAVNTLARTPEGWDWANTDVEGAKAALERLHAKDIVILGDGGAAVAVRLAAQALGLSVAVVTRRDAGLVRGAAVWTWPPQVEAPAGLRFEGTRVAVIAYGPLAREVATQVRARGGVPVFTGARWFVTQARAQRKLWERARQ